MMTSVVTAFHYSFPVIASVIKKEEPLQLEERQVLGTAFYLAEDFFVSAAHVLSDRDSYPHVGLGESQIDSWSGFEIADVETFEEIDLALLRVPGIQTKKSIQWEQNELVMLDKVQSMGYPYGLDSHDKVIRVRGYQGHIVCPRGWTALSALPRAYEFSFLAPRGLSGAPLMTLKWQKPPTLAGMVIGNMETDMTIVRGMGVDSDGNHKTVYETIERLHQGIAIQTQSLMSVESTMLGSTVSQYLSNHGLLVG